MSDKSKVYEADLPVGTKVRLTSTGNIAVRTKGMEYPWTAQATPSVGWLATTMQYYLDSGMAKVIAEDDSVDSEGEATPEPEVVEVPWIDGTTREVEKGTPVLVRYPDGGPEDTIRFAYRGCYATAVSGECFSWNDRKVIAVYGKTDEPPVKIEVPTKLGAVVRGRDGRTYVRFNTLKDKTTHSWVSDAAKTHSNGTIRNWLATEQADVISGGVDD